MVPETGDQFQVESCERLKKWYSMPLCLTLSIIRYVSRVKWSNPWNGEASSPYLGVEAIEKGTFETPSTTVANLLVLDRNTWNHVIEQTTSFRIWTLSLISFPATVTVAHLLLRHKRAFKRFLQWISLSAICICPLPTPSCKISAHILLSCIVWIHRIFLYFIAHIYIHTGGVHRINGYRHRKWTRWYVFKFWKMRMSTFHRVLIILKGKIWI